MKTTVEIWYAWGLTDKYGILKGSIKFEQRRSCLREEA